MGDPTRTLTEIEREQMRLVARLASNSGHLALVLAIADAPGADLRLKGEDLDHLPIGYAVGGEHGA